LLHDLVAGIAGEHVEPCPAYRTTMVIDQRQAGVTHRLEAGRRRALAVDERIADVDHADHRVGYRDDGRQLERLLRGRREVDRHQHVAVRRRGIGARDQDTARRGAHHPLRDAAEQEA
jgi:hypothetical protein